MERRCKHCSKTLSGRVDKLFCDANCRGLFHYSQNKEKKTTLFERVDKQIKLNRRLLKHFNQAGKSTIRSDKLISAGFNPRYFTHYWKNKQGQVYLFCYDVGFLALEENGKKKYLLIDWQDYMSPLT